MMSRWQWLIATLSTQLWLRASLYGAVAVVTALVSIYFGHLLPDDLSRDIGADAVDGILSILASSMLAVTIFSLSTMVAAFSRATSNLTPRATRLLLEDKTSQNALSTFLGSFIYSVVGIIALSAGIYGESGRLVLFVVTIAVIATIIVTLLRWIHYLGRLGLVVETVELIENAATSALKERRCNPYLDGTPLLSDDALPAAAVPTLSEQIGYIQHIDIALLSDIANRHEAQIYLRAMPGTFVDLSSALALCHGLAGIECDRQIRKAFVIGRERSFRQDPRYGMVVLAEVAIRALSPAVNDPGTAIHVIGVGVRILSVCNERAGPARQDPLKYPRIHVAALAVEDLFEDFFPPIARDGAGILEVATRLQKALATLKRTQDEDLVRSATYHAELALKRGLSALVLEEEKAALVKAAEC